MISTDLEFYQFAYSNYDNPKSVSIKEFESDIRRFTHINNLLNRYRTDKLDLKDRLIVNHVVIVCNCFTVYGALKMFDYKVASENTEVLNTFLVYLGHIKQQVVDKYLMDILEKE